MKAGGRPTARTAGFTLIELLVVLIIIGVLATFVTLSMSGRATDDRMKSETDRLAEIFRLASDEAQANGVEFGFRDTDEGFDFLTLDPSGNWTPVEDGVFRARQVPTPFFLELRIEGRLIKPVHAKITGKTGIVGKAGAADDQDKDKSDKKFFDNAAAKKAEDKPAPQVLILSTGEMSAFTLDLKLKDYKSFFRLEGNELGELTTARVEERR